MLEYLASDRLNALAVMKTSTHLRGGGRGFYLLLVRHTLPSYLNLHDGASLLLDLLSSDGDMAIAHRGPLSLSEPPFSVSRPLHRATHHSLTGRLDSDTIPLHAEGVVRLDRVS